MTEEQRQMIQESELARVQEEATHSETMPQWAEYGGDSFGVAYDPYEVTQPDDDFGDEEFPF